MSDATAWDPFEAYRDYTVHVLPLMVHFAWRRVHDPVGPASVHEILDREVDIRRKTSFYQRRDDASPEEGQEECLRLREALAVRIVDHGTEADTAPLEAECWALLSPLVESVLEQTCPRSWELREQPYQCWSYGLPEDDAKSLYVHFANAYQPDSPFGACRP